MLAELITRIVRQVIGNDPYSKVWEVKVAKDNGDGTVDVIPEDPRLNAPEIRGVRVRRGVAGFRETVEKGAGLLLAFANGDPEKPYCLGFTDVKADVKFNNGSAAVARVGDTIDMGKLAYTPGGPSTVGILTWTPPAGYNPPTDVPLSPTPAPLTGIVSSGNERLKA